MKTAKIIETGLTGAATLTLLQEALGAIDRKAPDTHFLHKGSAIKEVKRGIRKGGLKAVKTYLKVAGELLSMAGVFGLSAVGKKRHAVLRGGLLGGLVGTGVAFLQDRPEGDEERSVWRNRLLTVALYIIGGLIAGKAYTMLQGKKGKKK